MVGARDTREIEFLADKGCKIPCRAPLLVVEIVVATVAGMQSLVVSTLTLAVVGLAIVVVVLTPTFVMVILVVGVLLVLVLMALVVVAVVVMVVVAVSEVVAVNAVVGRRVAALAWPPADGVARPLMLTSYYQVVGRLA